MSGIASSTCCKSAAGSCDPSRVMSGPLTTSESSPTARLRSLQGDERPVSLGCALGEAIQLRSLQGDERPKRLPALRLPRSSCCDPSRVMSGEVHATVDLDGPLLLRSLQGDERPSAGFKWLSQMPS